VLRAGDLGPNAPSVNGPPHLTLIGGAIVDCPGKVCLLDICKMAKAKAKDLR